MRPDRLARLHRAVDRQAAEWVVIVPFAGGDYLAGGPDPARQALEIRAIVTDLSRVAHSEGSGAASGHNADLRLGSHAIKFTRSAVPYRLAPGDRVVLLQRDLREMKLSFAEPFGTGRTVARLEPLSGSQRSA